MKTNYKQSQAAPHAKPIFTVSRNDSTLYVLPAYLAGAVMIRLQHIADGDKVKKLCCKVKNDRLMAMEQDVPQGNVTLTAAVRAAAAAAEQEADEILARKQNVQRKNYKRQAVAKA